MDIRPIKTDEDFECAIRRIDELWHAKEGTSEGDELEVWLTLVEAYEKEHHPMPPPTLNEAIEFQMDQLGITKADLARMLGSRGRVSEILSGKHKLTVRMLKRLHNELGVPADVLLAD